MPISSEGKSCEERVGMVDVGSVAARVAVCARSEELVGLRGQRRQSQMVRVKGQSDGRTVGSPTRRC
eukprot:scaffold35168_cov31-Tisochrysis_lutea.AAC.2